jgi:hypothetical protein
MGENAPACVQPRPLAEAIYAVGTKNTEKVVECASTGTG